jgi:hypothetical protein
VEIFDLERKYDPTLTGVVDGQFLVRVFAHLCGNPLVVVLSIAPLRYGYY